MYEHYPCSRSEALLKVRDEAALPTDQSLDA
jgi:hypothetical protein